MKNPDAYENLQRGIHKLHQEDYYGAIDDFTNAIKIHNDYIEAYLARADAKMSTQDTYQILSALPDYEKVISLDPRNAKAIAGRGRLHMSLNPDDEDGLKDLEKAAAIDIKESSYFNIGIARLQLGDFTKAIEAFKKYINLEKPEDHWLGETHYFIGRCYHSLDNYQNAIIHYQDGIKYKANQNYEYCFLNKADCLIQLNKFDDAISDLKKVIQLKPDNIEVYLTLSKILVQKNNSDDAIEILQSALKIDSNNIDILFYLSEVLFRSEKYEHALTVNRKLINLDSENFGPHFNKALCFFKLSKFEDCISAFDDALEIEPSRGHAYFYRGMAYMNLKSNNACRDWKLALNNGVDDAKRYIDNYCKTG